MTWRERLRYVVINSGVRQNEIARRAGVAPETLGRILAGKQQPAFTTVVRIARAVRVHVGWLLDERGHFLSPDQVRDLRKAVQIIQAITEDR